MNLRLPYPPSVNMYWRHNRGVIHISRHGKQFRQDVLAIVLKTGARHGEIRKEKLSVVIAATMPDHRRRDVDNLHKATLDALEHAGVYESDNQIDDLRIYRAGVEKPGWLDVELRVM